MTTRSRPASGRSGHLVIVSTPIGNLGDLTDRARSALRDADRILCEDTRHTRKLLASIDTRARLESFHEHNENERIDEVIRWLNDGQTIALVSDAGTPALSDPGFTLVRRARELGLRVEPIPGPFAAATALVASGIAPHPFTFWGFPPRKKGERLRFYERARATGTTAVVYEAPHRLLASLEDARSAYGDVEMTVAREMTKLHEEFVHGTISSVLEALSRRASILGEITIVFAAAPPAPQEAPDAAALRAELETLQEAGVSRGEAIRAIAERHKLRRNDLYRLLL